MKFIVLALVLVSCLAGYVDLDHTSHFVIRSGDSKYLFIKSNPTTGYSWVAEPLASKSFSLSYLGYLSDYSDKAGAGGIQVFRLSCSSDALGDRVSLTFSYKRSWENTPVKVKVVTVQSIRS